MKEDNVMILGYGLIGAVLVGCMAGVAVYSLFTTFLVPSTYYAHKLDSSSYRIFVGNQTAIFHSNIPIDIDSLHCWKITLDVNEHLLNATMADSRFCHM